MIMINPLKCFIGSEGHVALDRNPGPEYPTLAINPRSFKCISP